MIFNISTVIQRNNIMGKYIPDFETVLGTMIIIFVVAILVVMVRGVSL